MAVENVKLLQVFFRFLKPLHWEKQDCKKTNRKKLKWEEQWARNKKNLTIVRPSIPTGSQLPEAADGLFNKPNTSYATPIIHRVLRGGNN